MSFTKEPISERIFEKRLSHLLRHQPKPKRRGMLWDGRMHVGQKSQSLTTFARRWRTVLRIKRWAKRAGVRKRVERFLENIKVE
jgi:hypothetical protein